MSSSQLDLAAPGAAGRWFRRGPAVGVLAAALLGPAAPVVAAAPVAPPAVAAPAVLRQPGPLSPRNASYTLRARLDERSHRVVGQGTLAWRNLERQPVDRLVFHLYLNAFKNYASTFVRDAGPQLRGDQMEAHGFGSIDVKSLKVGGQELLPQATLDDTLLTVPLPRPVGPGAAVQVDFTFEDQLPRVFARSGYAGAFHAVGQWFPKIGVWDCGPGPDGVTAALPGACRWRAHQYHGNTEFFADYGTYDVELDVPAADVVGATGVQVGERPADAGRKIVRYRAEDVHDFVWVADPRFIEVRDTVRDEWGEVAIRLLTLAPYTGMNDRHLRATREGLLELERRFGVYPYSSVTVVVPPGDAVGAAGMEYPTLFLTLPGVSPARVRFAEETTLHELGHQYFYGLLGSDEVEEPWLDEGLNQTFTQWGVERLSGPRCNMVSLFGVCLSMVDIDWLGYRSVLRRAPVVTAGPDFPPRTYGGVVYSQTAITLRTLERYLGATRLEGALRRYAERYRFRHPRRADFVAAFDEGAGEDLRWFWDQALTTTRVADYEVYEARTTRHRPAAGLWDCPPVQTAGTPHADPEVQELRREAQEAACRPGPPGAAPRRVELDPDQGQPKAGDSSGRGSHDSEVWIRRRGEFIFPVTVLLTFRDGSTERERWTVAEQQRQPEVRARRFRYLRRSSPLVRVEVDPDQVLALDERRLNNGLLVQPDPVPARRLAGTWLGLLQTVLDLLST